MLRQFHPLFVSIHSNHPRELTTEVRDALGRLAGAGIPLGNQSVLLKHVNDDPLVMRAHLQKLLLCRVKPYYLYQCDLIAGSAHLRASVRKGLEVMESLRGTRPVTRCRSMSSMRPVVAARCRSIPSMCSAATPTAWSSAISKGKFSSIPKPGTARRSSPRRAKSRSRNWSERFLNR